MSYKKLDIWERAREISIAIHKMTLTELPKFEMYDLHNHLEILGKKLNLFIQAVEHNFNQQPATSNKKPEIK